MKSIITLLMLLILNVSAATAAAPAQKDKSTTQKELKNNKKHEKINAAYELLKSHQFVIHEYSYYDREYFFCRSYILRCDKTEPDPQHTKVISEEINNNKYTLILASVKQHQFRKCIFKITFDLESGVLEARYFVYDHDENKDPATADISKQGRGRRAFVGDYTNILPLDQRQGW